MTIEIEARQLEALGNPTKLNICRTPVRAGPNGLPVGRVQEPIGLAAPTLSHHIGRLVGTGPVTQDRQGTTLIYRANYRPMIALLGYLQDEWCADEACFVNEEMPAA
jgi:ArsR family transcriptional regulator, arsenate/arsenite/antimonite-responsive transcriptional repressor